MIKHFPQWCSPFQNAWINIIHQGNLIFLCFQKICSNIEPTLAFKLLALHFIVLLLTSHYTIMSLITCSNLLRKGNMPLM
jgi:hypothetical protein